MAEVSGGQTAVNIINALHTARGLPATFASNDPATIMAQVIDERKRELFLQSQRFYDINRFNLPLDPAPGTSYGYKGGFYGDMRCFPLGFRSASTGTFFPIRVKSSSESFTFAECAIASK